MYLFRYFIQFILHRGGGRRGRGHKCYFIQHCSLEAYFDLDNNVWPDTELTFTKRFDLLIKVMWLLGSEGLEAGGSLSPAEMQ